MGICGLWIHIFPPSLALAAGYLQCPCPLFGLAHTTKHKLHINRQVKTTRLRQRSPDVSRNRSEDLFGTQNPLLRALEVMNKEYLGSTTFFTGRALAGSGSTEPTVCPIIVLNCALACCPPRGYSRHFYPRTSDWSSATEQGVSHTVTE